MKNRNFANLNVNPCKMCMPMGAVTVFKGIENSMMILHGSQGCSTYIRRHMAGHYNEPVDIASSSLNEEGTVYGGAENLKKGLRNIIKLYSPRIIGVATTCLAETIGEDISRITSEFMVDENIKDLMVIPVSTPGYSGTHYEGFYSAVLSVVKCMARNYKNEKINIIPGTLNPGDVRNIKNMLDAFGVKYNMLPDISETLDAPYRSEYKRIPAGGTTASDIESMGGAAATIELGLTVPEQLSPGKYLMETFGVPLYRCPLPIGLINTDSFINLLSALSGNPVPEFMRNERGRLIDAMVDSHKHNAEGRAAIYGEPDIVYAVSKICDENGIKPVLISTGAKSPVLVEHLESLHCNSDAKPLIIDDTDFETIQKRSVELNVNIAIGNSDGKVLTEKEDIPLVRVGFPIHDRVGGQRIVLTGYNGSMSFLDNITNTLLQSKYEKYRKSMYDRYYMKSDARYDNPAIASKNDMDRNSNPISAQNLITTTSRQEKTATTAEHPCFGSGACGNARMHIPVAPACNIKCNYCNRKYDCTNESRPGVTSSVLTPEEAAEKFVAVKEKIDNLKVVGIAGPGDALANFEKTKEAIEMIKQIDPEIMICLSTNGLMLPHYAHQIAELGISHVTITINAINPAIGAAVYGEVNYLGKKYSGEEGAALLMKNQLDGLRMLVSKEVICKVNIVVIKGVNDSHIEDVVKKVKELGAFITNIMPLIPVEGSKFEDMEAVSTTELNEIRKKCSSHIRQMYHCKQCRADAIGTLTNDRSAEFDVKSCGSCSSKEAVKEASKPLNKTSVQRRFAVASDNGILVDKHFGQVNEFHIFSYDGSSVQLIEKRKVQKYCKGEEECDEEKLRIKRLMKAIEDCEATLVLRIGYRPRKELEEKGMKVVEICGRIDDAVKSVAASAFEPSKSEEKPSLMQA